MPHIHNNNKQKIVCNRNTEIKKIKVEYKTKEQYKSKSIKIRINQVNIYKLS